MLCHGCQDRVNNHIRGYLNQLIFSVTRFEVPNRMIGSIILETIYFCQFNQKKKKEILIGPEFIQVPASFHPSGEWFSVRALDDTGPNHNHRKSFSFWHCLAKLMSRVGPPVFMSRAVSYLEYLNIISNPILEW